MLARILDLLRTSGWSGGLRKLSAGFLSDHGIPSDAVRSLFSGWVAWELGNYSQAEARFLEVQSPAELKAWAVAGRAFVARSQRRLDLSTALLDEAERIAGANDVDLRGVIAHGRGSLLLHQGRRREAQKALRDALNLLRPPHFLAARVFDSLGMAWAATSNFYAASEFFLRSLQLKQSNSDGEADLAGLALTHGQLGRLYLDWGLLELAERHFREDLQLVLQLGDLRSQAQMYAFLGVVMLRQAEIAGFISPTGGMQAHLREAGNWLDQCLRLVAAEPSWAVLEGFTRKDRALVWILQGRLTEAEHELNVARQVFDSLNFAEGLAHVDRCLGMLLRLLNRPIESVAPLERAAAWFSEKVPTELGRAQLEIARIRRALGDPQSVVVEKYRQALLTAELSRRPALVREVEAELRAVDPAAWAMHVFGRVRGRSVQLSTHSLREAEREIASVLYLDIQGSTEFAREREPEQVLLIFNQMMADLEAVLREFHGQISSYRGDGFLAWFRGQGHAERATEAALQLLAAVAEFNEPRLVLEQTPLIVRVGIATGELCFGNVGTYDKMDFTVIASAANLGARLESRARVNGLCVSEATRELIHSRFSFSPDSPETAELKGFGRQSFWHVTGRLTCQV